MKSIDERLRMKAIENKRSRINYSNNNNVERQQKDNDGDYMVATIWSNYFDEKIYWMDQCGETNIICYTVRFTVHIIIFYVRIIFDSWPVNFHDWKCTAHSPFSYGFVGREREQPPKRSEKKSSIFIRKTSTHNKSRPDLFIHGNKMNAHIPQLIFQC